MKARSFCILCFLFVLCPSCFKTHDKWDRDYYDYHIGAIINDEEYHEVKHFIYKRGFSYGFTSFDINGYTVISSGDSDISYSPSAKSVFALDLGVFIDTTSFKSIIFPATFYFDGKTDDDLRRFYLPHLYNESDTPFDSLWAFARFCSHQVFFAQEGFITIGRFDNERHNIDRVSFEFIGMDDKGERIVVKDGYMNAYFKVR